MIVKMVQMKANVSVLAVLLTVETSVTGMWTTPLARDVLWHTLGWRSRVLQALLEQDPQKTTQQV